MRTLRGIILLIIFEQDADIAILERGIGDILTARFSREDLQEASLTSTSAKRCWYESRSQTRSKSRFVIFFLFIPS